MGISSQEYQKYDAKNLRRRVFTEPISNTHFLEPSKRGGSRALGGHLCHPPWKRRLGAAVCHTWAVCFKIYDSTWRSVVCLREGGNFQATYQPTIHYIKFCINKVAGLYDPGGTHPTTVSLRGKSKQLCAQSMRTVGFIGSHGLSIE